MGLKTFRIPGTDAEIMADFAQGANPIYVRYGPDMDWMRTPFQVSHANYHASDAAYLVKNWRP